MPTHFQNVQALRGVACLSVVLLHLWVLETAFGVSTPGFRAVEWFGFAGVDLFFVLSGFIITATNRAHLGRPAAVPGYLFRRLWRVYPTYWAVALASFVVLRVTLGPALVDDSIRQNWPWWAALVPIRTENALVGPAWTLSYEVMFYLAFGVLMPGPPRLLAAGLAGWALVVLAAATQPTPDSPLVKCATSPFVLEFLGGCAVAWLSGRGVRRWWRAALAVGLGYGIVATVVAARTVTVPYLDAMAGQWLRVAVFGPPAVLIVYGFVAAEGAWPRAVPGWLLRLGDASYSLYLIHTTVLYGAKWVGVVVPHSRLPHLLWLAGTLAATIAAGLALHHWVERPLLALGKRRRAANATAPAAPAEAPLRTAA